MSIRSMSNATINLVKPLPAATVTGKLVYGAGTAADERCVLDAPTFVQTKLPAVQSLGATAVLYIDKPTAIAVATGTRLTITVDGSAAVEYEVISTVDRQKRGGLAHIEAFLKGVR